MAWHVSTSHSVTMRNMCRCEASSLSTDSSEPPPFAGLCDTTAILWQHLACYSDTPVLQLRIVKMSPSDLGHAATNGVKRMFGPDDLPHPSTASPVKTSETSAQALNGGGDLHGVKAAPPVPQSHGNAGPQPALEDSTSFDIVRETMKNNPALVNLIRYMSLHDEQRAENARLIATVSEKDGLIAEKDRLIAEQARSNAEKDALNAGNNSRYEAFREKAKWCETELKVLRAKERALYGSKDDDDEYVQVGSQEDTIARLEQTVLCQEDHVKNLEGVCAHRQECIHGLEKKLGATNVHGGKSIGVPPKMTKKQLRAKTAALNAEIEQRKQRIDAKMGRKGGNVGSGKANVSAEKQRATVEKSKSGADSPLGALEKALGLVEERMTKMKR